MRTIGWAAVVATSVAVVLFIVGWFFPPPVRHVLAIVAPSLFLVGIVLGIVWQALMRRAGHRP